MCEAQDVRDRPDERDGPSGVNRFGLSGQSGLFDLSRAMNKRDETDKTHQIDTRVRSALEGLLVPAVRS